jgi:hypothetical protein
MEIGELKTYYYVKPLETLSERSRTAYILGNELLDPTYLSFPPLDHDDHLLVQNFDATMAFNKLQLSLRQHKWKLSLVNHIHCALAATHILLLSRNQYPEDLSPLFSNEDLKATINGIESKYGVEELPMSMEAITSMYGIAQDLTMGVISRDKAVAHLLDLDLPTDDNKFKNCVINLIRKLPAVPIAEDVKELELSTRYVDPFLSGLFDDPDEGMYLMWSNELPLEARQQEEPSIKRPDICISRLHGTTSASNHAYGGSQVSSARW